MAMREFATLPRQYVPDPLVTDAEITICGQNFVHIAKVLRRREGDVIRAFNAQDGEWLSEIIDIQKRDLTLRVQDQLRTYVAPTDIWLVFAPVKKHRNVFIVEKATELGAAYIQPVLTARTGKINDKTFSSKMKAHIIHAAEQTERVDLPGMGAPKDLQSLIETWDERRTLIFADEGFVMDGTVAIEPAAQVLAKIKPPCAILIGPEGGFTDEERLCLRDKNFVRAISLGPRILRADTAATATLALWQALSGDWGKS